MNQENIATLIGALIMSVPGILAFYIQSRKSKDDEETSDVNRANLVTDSALKYASSQQEFIDAQEDRFEQFRADMEGKLEHEREARRELASKLDDERQKRVKMEALLNKERLLREEEVAARDAEIENLIKQLDECYQKIKDMISNSPSGDGI